MGKKIRIQDIEPITDEEIVAIQRITNVYLRENDIDCQSEVELSKAVIGLIKRLKTFADSLDYYYERYTGHTVTEDEKPAWQKE